MELFRPYETKLCILIMVRGFSNKAALFDLFLILCFLYSCRQNFNMVYSYGRNEIEFERSDG